MLHGCFYDVLAIGAAVGTEVPDMNAKRLHHLEETPVSLCLHGRHSRTRRIRPDPDNRTDGQRNPSVMYR